MEPDYVPPKQSPQRNIPITFDRFGMGNIEAWTNIIRSYQQLHPDHKVILTYLGEPVQSVVYLLKAGRPYDRGGFEMSVAAPDEDFSHVAKLFRLLVEGAGEDYEKFIQRELHRTLKLF